MAVSTLAAAPPCSAASSARVLEVAALDAAEKRIVELLRRGDGQDD
jgi:hypothetical protein